MKAHILTFANFVVSTDHFMHTLVNLWCDFPEHRESQTMPQQWSEKEKHDFIIRVTLNSPDKFKQFGYYIHNGELNWSVRPPK